MNAGRFVVLDGPDGCGKSTQARRLVERLGADGRDVLHTREPGGTRTGEAIRALLLDPSRGEITLRTELLLYMASRAQIVEEVLRPALAAGRLIVCERYLSSSVAYQGVAGGLGADAVAQVGAFATGGLAPDLTVVLDIDARAGLARIARGKDRLEGRSLEFHEAVRRGFLDLARNDPSRYSVVDARGAEDEVASRVWTAVAPVVASSSS